MGNQKSQPDTTEANDTDELLGDTAEVVAQSPREVVRGQGDVQTEPHVGIVYKTRWYIMLIYCMQTLTEASVWNTWGPIQVCFKYIILLNKS